MQLNRKPSSQQSRRGRRHAVLIIVPAFNEEAALPGCVQGLLQAGNDWDVLVVNDGSTDQTQAVAEALAVTDPRVRVVKLPVNCGIGSAVQTGLLYAEQAAYDYAVQYDGDGQHDADSLAALVAHAQAYNLDLCVGSRFKDSSAGNFRSTPLRRLGIVFFAWLIGRLAGASVTDPTSGFRCYGQRAVAFFARHYPDDYPEPEALFWCMRNGLRVGEVPVRMRQRQGGVSSIRYLHTVYYMIKVTMAIVIDRLRMCELESR